MDLPGSVVVVTGGAGGIGAALARRFAREGARAVVVADLDEAGARRLAEELDCPAPLFAGVDVTDPAAVGALVDRVEREAGPIDLWCSNAGVALGLDHGEDGIRVSCLCPQGVRTAMTAREGAGSAVLAAGALLEPEEVADAVVEGLADGRFLILPHPEVAEFERRRAGDRERWLGGMRRLRARLGAGAGEG